MMMGAAVRVHATVGFGVGRMAAAQWGHWRRSGMRYHVIGTRREHAGQMARSLGMGGDLSRWRWGDCVWDFVGWLMVCRGRSHGLETRDTIWGWMELWLAVSAWG